MKYWHSNVPHRALKMFQRAFPNPNSDIKCFHAPTSNNLNINESLSVLVPCHLMTYAIRPLQRSLSFVADSRACLL